MALLKTQFPASVSDFFNRLLDLDNLQTNLGVRSIEAVFIVDAGANGDVEIIEGFSMNLAVPPTCVNPSDCNDGNICTDDACVGAVCQYTNNTSRCDDGDACTTNDTCSVGTCVGGLAPNCDDGNICTDDFCNPTSGCIHSNNTKPCNDGNACTINDTCSGGVCDGGSALNCDDGNVCTDDSCEPSTGCVYAYNTAPCDDGDACTTNDVCDGQGSCVGIPIPAPDCPACRALVDAPQRRELLVILRDVRDSMLKASALGREYVDLYYRHSSEVTRLMLLHPELRLRVQNLLEHYVPVLGRGRGGDEPILTRSDVRSIERILKTFERYASVDLRVDLATTRIALRKGRLPELVGMRIERD